MRPVVGGMVVTKDGENHYPNESDQPHKQRPHNYFLCHGRISLHCGVAIGSVNTEQAACQSERDISSLIIYDISKNSLGAKALTKVERSSYESKTILC